MSFIGGVTRLSFLFFLILTHPANQQAMTEQHFPRAYTTKPSITDLVLADAREQASKTPVLAEHLIALVKGRKGVLGNDGRIKYTIPEYAEPEEIQKLENYLGKEYLHNAALPPADGTVPATKFEVKPEVREDEDGQVPTRWWTTVYLWVPPSMLK